MRFRGSSDAMQLSDEQKRQRRRRNIALVKMGG
jgi:hypothetical protein